MTTVTLIDYDTERVLGRFNAQISNNYRAGELLFHHSSKIPSVEYRIEEVEMHEAKGSVRWRLKVTLV